jgi:hypothetical protein
MQIMLTILQEIFTTSFHLSPKEQVFQRLKHYYWDEPHLYRHGPDGIIRWCIPDHEIQGILLSAHRDPYGGHHAGDRTAAKVLQSGFYWLNIFKDAHQVVKDCDTSQTYL